jgi:C_GCAxxG_C_C family probable redox protein
MKMNLKGKLIVAKNCGELLDAGYHCSEAMLVGVGSLLFPLNPQTIKMSTGFAGGIGSSKAGLCGALSGGVMVIGGLYGRTDPKVSDEKCQQLCADFQRRFEKEFGCVQCAELKANWVGKPGQERCVQLVEKAAEILLEILGE